MFEKFQKWFKGQPANGAQNSEDSADVRPQMDKQESVANSEFTIKYNRHKGSIPRLNPIGRDLFLTDSKAESNKMDIMAYIIHCPKHDTVAVYEDPNSGIKWLPFTPTCPEKYAPFLF